MPLSNLTYEELQVLMKRLLRKLGQPTRLTTEQLTSDMVAWRVDYIRENRVRFGRALAI